ncbi:MAG: outer membrane lipoprotein-sorting protein [Opitutae bacterium]|nr:outer membrane lipoprotein-sorting protein [Opitutae bacterium]
MFLALALLAAVPAGALAQPPPFRPPPRFVGAGKADQAEGRAVLDAFRGQGIAGTYWLAFELRVMPRRGDERTVAGQLLGTRSAAGPVTRLTFPGRAGAAAEQRWLIRSGAAPAAWSWQSGAAAPRALTGADTFQAVGDTDLTLFDLQMPFLYWPDFVYEGLAKIRGRPAHSFVLYPPADFAAQRPQLTGVRVALDTQFGALVQAELLGANGQAAKTITVIDMKKVGEQWLVREIDLRNTVTRDKTRFIVKAAALNLSLPADVFEAAGLPRDTPAIPAAAVEHL